MTSSGLQMLLERLDGDHLCAGRKYRDLTVTLSLFCERRMRRPADADDIVRRTIDIVAAKLAGGNDILNLRAYSFAVARHLLRDYRKRVLPEHIDEHLARTLKCTRHLAQVEYLEKEAKDECRQRCLNSLPTEQRDLILKYYHRGLHCKPYREQMARELEINIEALNNRISRIRKKLCQCCSGCTNRLKTSKLPAIALCAQEYISSAIVHTID